jgi:putative transposase
MKKSKFTEEQIVKILAEAQRGDKTVKQVCQTHGVSENTYYIWKRRFGGMKTDEVRRLRELEHENARLKKLLAERSLEVDALTELIQGNGWASPSGSRGRGR